MPRFHERANRRRGSSLVAVVQRAATASAYPARPVANERCRVSSTIQLYLLGPGFSLREWPVTAGRG